VFRGEIEKLWVRGIAEWLTLKAEEILIHVKPLFITSG
jgi:hypothetical protein